MPSTANKGYSVQTTGSNVGTWGTELNVNTIQVIDSNFGGIFSKSLASSNYTLTPTEAQNGIYLFSGALLANVVVTSAAIGFVKVINKTTGNFSVTLTNGVGTTVIVPQYTARDVVFDSVNGLTAVGLPSPGILAPLAVPASALHPSLAGEWVLPYGQSSAGYPSLVTLFGGTLPDLRGRSLFAADNMGGSAAGRLTSGGSGVNGSTVGSVGGNQSTSLGTSQMPSHNHAITISDPGHAHTSNNNLGGFASLTSADVNVFTIASGSGVGINANTTGITATSANVGSGTAFGTINPAYVVNWMMKT